MSDLEFCITDWCDMFAEFVVVKEDGDPIPLCTTCAEAFQLGQRYPDAMIEWKEVYEYEGD